MNDLLYNRIYEFLDSRQIRAVEVVEPFAVGSTIGSVRDRNEDVAVIVTVKHARSPNNDYTLALVCDGMGGMKRGREAALIASSTFVSQMLRTESNDSPSNRLSRALVAAQREVFEELRGDGGTTLSAICLCGAAQAWLLHVGDSRIYMIAPDNTLRQISRDDTIGAALNREDEKSRGSQPFDPVHWYGR